MKTQLIDISLVTLNVPTLADSESLRRQFIGTDPHNEENLNTTHDLLKDYEGKPILASMAHIDAGSGRGSSLEDVIDLACNALQIPVKKLVRPSLAQIGSLVSHFREESGIVRSVPIIQDDQVYALSWKRNWPAEGRHIFRVERSRYLIHGSVWVMLCTDALI